MTDISREEALVHFGVRGQKWGVRKNKSSTKEIKEARAKVNKTDMALYEARTKLKKMPESQARAEATQRFNALTKAHRESPEKAIAKRFTTGDKVRITAAGAVAVTAILYAYGMDRVENPRSGF